MEPVLYNDQLGTLLVDHLLFDPHADLFTDLHGQLPKGAGEKEAPPPPRPTAAVRRADIGDSSSSEDEAEAAPGANHNHNKHKGGRKLKRLQPRPTDNARVDRWGRPIPDTLALPEAALAQYAPLYAPARFTAERPEAMGTSLDTALVMLRAAFGAGERIDPQTVVVTASVITSPQVFRLYAIEKPEANGPVVALNLNVTLIWRQKPDRVQVSMIYAALGLKAFFEWWATERDNRPSSKRIDRFLDQDGVVLKLGRDAALPNALDYAPLLALDPPMATGPPAGLEGWIANARARFVGVPAIEVLPVRFETKKQAVPRFDIGNYDALVVRNDLFNGRTEADVVQLLLVAFARWCKRHLGLDATGHYVNAGGRLDLLFSKAFDKAFIA